MTKSKQSKLKSVNLGKSSNGSNAVAKEQKNGLTKKSAENTSPGTSISSISVLSGRISETISPSQEQTQNIQESPQGSSDSIISTQDHRSSSPIESQSPPEVTKKRRTSQPEDETNLYPGKGISFVNTSEFVEIEDDREDAQVHDVISQISTKSNHEGGILTEAISTISTTSKTSAHPKTSVHKKAKESQELVHKKSKASQDTVRTKGTNKFFYIYKLKARPKSVVEIQWKPQEDNISIRSQIEAVEVLRKDSITSQTVDIEDVEVESRYSDILKQLRDIPNWNELDNLSDDVEEDKPEDTSGKIRDPLAPNSTDFAKADADTDPEGLHEDQPSQLKLSSHSLAEVSSSEIEDSDSFDDVDLRLSSQFPDKDETPFKYTSVYLDSDEKEVVGSKLPSFDMNATIDDFLYEIIDKVVGIAAKPERQLSQILDKDKLMDTLVDEANEHRVEKFIHQNLSKRVTDILVRRCKFSLVTPSKNANVNDNNKSRCLAALNELDYWLKREKLSIKVARKEVQGLVVEENTKRTEDDDLWQRLENLMNGTLLQRPNVSDNLKNLTGNIIKRLRNMRDELSATRLNLILKQHTYSHIKTKIDKMDTIAENLTTQKYLSVEAQVENLDRTLEARNLSVVKSSNLINSKIHTVSHLRCRRKILSRKLSTARGILESLRQQFKVLRLKAYRCNKMHNRLFTELDNVRHKGGIMLYPLLIMDFDHTVEALARKRSEIEALWAQHDNLLDRLTTLEEARRVSEENRNEFRNQLRYSTLVERMEKR